MEKTNRKRNIRGLLVVMLILVCLVFAGCTQTQQGDQELEQGESELYKTVEQYLTAEFTEVYSPYYEILDLEISNWQEDGDEATFFYTMTAKNFDRDPDTVQYIIDAKNNNSPYYEQMKQEYLEPKEFNYEFKAELQDGEILLYYNASPNGTDWQRTEVSDYIIKD